MLLRIRWRAEQIMGTLSDDPRRTDVAPLVERGDADRVQWMPAPGGRNPNTACEDRGDLVAEGADQDATVLACRESGGERSPRPGAFGRTASLEGGGP